MGASRLAVSALTRDTKAARHHIRALTDFTPLTEKVESPHRLEEREPLTHAAFGHLLSAQLAVRTQDDEAALAALSSLAAFDVDRADDVARALDPALPGTDLVEAVARSRRQGERARAALSASRESATALQIAPNPSAGRVRLLVTVEDASEVEVSVYDALGRRVATAAHQPVGAGSSEIRANLGSLPPGVYVARMQLSGVASSATVRFTITR